MLYCRYIVDIKWIGYFENALDLGIDPLSCHCIHLILLFFLFNLWFVYCFQMKTIKNIQPVLILRFHLLKIQWNSIWFQLISVKCSVRTLHKSLFWFFILFSFSFRFFSVCFLVNFSFELASICIVCAFIVLYMPFCCIE